MHFGLSDLKGGEGVRLVWATDQWPAITKKNADIIMRYGHKCMCVCVWVVVVGHLLSDAQAQWVASSTVARSQPRSLRTLLYGQPERVLFLKGGHALWIG